jgi:hypothetical protein
MPYFVAETIEVAIGSPYRWPYVFCAVFPASKTTNPEKVLAILRTSLVALISRLLLDNGGFW